MGQLSAFAIRRAKVRFPTPSGPERIKAWGSRPVRSLFLMRSTILGLPMNSSKRISQSKDFQDVMLDCFDGAVRRDHPNAVFLSRREIKITISHARVERNLFHL